MSIRLTDTATLHPLVLPARADVAASSRFLEYAEVRNASLRETTGRDDERMAAEPLRELLISDADLERRQWYILDGPEMIGIAVLNVIADDGGRTGMFTINVLRRAWSIGIGTAALRYLERQARDAGVQRLLLWTEHQDDGEDKLAAPTGFGAVPLDHVARFLRRHEFTLEQVERVSILTWSDPLAQRIRNLRARAEEASAPYRVIQWMLPTPREHVAGYAWMKQHMSTDVPDADLDMPPEEWDADRVARHDDRYMRLGSTVLVTAAQHVATGELCAYNELTIEGGPTQTSHQEDTLVLASHRGNRLGMLVKTAGLLTWHEKHPDSPAVITYNAEENRPMLDINEAIGFVPTAYEGAWKKELT
jgi:GNAT superfamily N-acetyltransferase